MARRSKNTKKASKKAPRTAPRRPKRGAASVSPPEPTNSENQPEEETKEAKIAESSDEIRKEEESSEEAPKRKTKRASSAERDKGAERNVQVPWGAVALALIFLGGIILYSEYSGGEEGGETHEIGADLDLDDPPDEGPDPDEQGGSGEGGEDGNDVGEGVERLRVQVVQRRRHDRRAFTQGLLWHQGQLFESTGLVGESTLRRVDLNTGEVQQRRVIGPPYFAEGLARVDDRLIQLTWQRGRAFVWNLETFEPIREFEYEGEGWGLCYDGERLIMSDGSARLTFRDPETFEIRGAVNVQLNGRPVRELNELECVEGQVYANVWQQDRIVRIDPTDGRVTAVIRADGLLSEDEAYRADVLNGIAWMPERRRFAITGKRWPYLFEVEFVPM